MTARRGLGLALSCSRCREQRGPPPVCYGHRASMLLGAPYQHLRMHACVKVEGALGLLVALKAARAFDGLPAAAAAAGPLKRDPAAPSLLPKPRCFSTRRKTAKAIGALHLQQLARREAFKRHKEGGKGGLITAAAANAVLPKYHANPHALLLPPPSAPALFDEVCVASTPATRRSLPLELLHGPPQRPLGRIFSLKSAELAAAVLRSARDHRNNGRLWRELGAACARRAPHLAAAEAALVLHGFAAAGCRALPVLQSCAETLLLKWPEARLLDAARGLHALVVVFGVRETRLLLRCIDSFGPLLLQQGGSVGRTKGCSYTLSPLQGLQQLQALSLLLKAFAALQLPYHPLLLVAAQTLQIHLEEALPRPPKQRGLTSSSSSMASLEGGCMQQQQTIFALPPLAAVKEAHLGGIAWQQQQQQRQQQKQQPVRQRLPGSLVLSLLQSLSRLGVRHEPLLRALDAFLAADLIPPTQAHNAPGAAAAAAAAAVYPAAASSASSAGSRRGPSHACSESGWLHRGACEKPLHAAAQHEARDGIVSAWGPQGAPWWGLGELSLAVQAVFAVGGGRSQLVAAWVHALRQSLSRCDETKDLVLALQAARVASFFCRPLLLQLLSCLTRRAADASMPIEPQGLLAAAAAAARLPAAAPAPFWSAVERCLLGLHAIEHDPVISSTSKKSNAACGSPNSLNGFVNEEHETCHAEAPMRMGAPRLSVSLELLADALEVLALAAPALPLDSLGPLLAAALRKLHTQGAPLSVSLRLLTTIRLLELKATSAGPTFALCFANNNSNSSNSSNSSSGSSSGSRGRGSVNLAFVREAWEAALGIVRLQVEPFLRQQETEASARDEIESAGRESWTSPAAAAAWRPLVEGPLAPGIGHLQELCVFGMLNQKELTRSSSSSSSSSNSNNCSRINDNNSSSSSSKLADVRRHVRCLLRRRRTSCPLVFVSTAEAAAALLLEVGPFVGDTAGLGVGASLELLSRLWPAEAPALQQKGGPWKPPPSRAAGDEAQHLGSDPSSPSPPPHQERLETEERDSALEAADAETLELILCCFSSRIVTAPTALVLLAARSTAAALMHPRWLAALQQHQQQKRQQQKQEQQKQKEQQQEPSCESKESVLSSPCDLRQQLQKMHEGVVCGDDENVVELLVAICLMSLETLQQRLPALHANELALLAVDVQALLSSLLALPGLGPPALASSALLEREQQLQASALQSLRGLPKQSQCSGWLGLEAAHQGSRHTQQRQENGADSGTSVLVLAGQLESLLQDVTQRWRSAPASITSAGPASSLNVWLRLGGGGRPLLGGPLREGGTALEGGVPVGVLRLYDDSSGQGAFTKAETTRQRIYRTATLEALCPGAYSAWEMRKWLYSQKKEIMGALAYQQGAPSGKASALRVFSSSLQLREQISLPVAKKAETHAAGDGGCCFDEDGQHDPSACSQKMQHWLINVEGLRREEAGGARSDTRGASGGLLRMQQHRDLNLTWLSQVIWSHT
ncbi:hypothetical protein Emag_000384 [Eimeria magna]